MILTLLQGAKRLTYGRPVIGTEAEVDQPAVCSRESVREGKKRG